MLGASPRFLIEGPSAPACRVVSSMVPLADPQNDVFAGLRLEQLPNGSWPVMVSMLWC